MSYGQKLRAWRKAQRLTQEELGNKIGFSDKFVSQHEREAGQPSQNFLEKSAELMGMTYAELVEDGGGQQTLNDRADALSKSGEQAHPVEIQQFQTALEVVLCELTEAQSRALTERMMKSGADQRLTLGVRQLIVTAAMKAGEKQKRQSLPKN